MPGRVARSILKPLTMSGAVGCFLNPSHSAHLLTALQKDFADWETKTHKAYCTVSSYDFDATARVLTNGLAHTKGKTILAVFYEPGASAPKMDYPKKDATEDDMKAFWEAKQKAAKELGEKELREQVRDFLEWLKAQGVI